MDYLLKASAVLIIFYVCYQLFLQRDTFFQANRWFLLSGLVMASCIPLIVIPNYIEYTLVDTSGVMFNTSATTPTALQEQPFDYTSVLIWTYVGGLFFFFGKLCIEFLSLRNILKTSRTTISEPYKIMETSENVAPFSFFNRIVYNPNQFKDEELEHVINHEKVHTKELHSIDTVIAQFTCILFWFNPIVWLYKKALQQNLEFIADQKAQFVSPCEKSYQTVLLKASVQNHQLAFTNNFYTSLIKKRIVMLHKSKSSQLNQLKFILVLPLLALFMMSFNTKDIYVAIPLEDPFSLEIPSEDSRSLETPLLETGDIEIIITKDTTDDELKTLQKKLADKGITFTYKNLKRNTKGDITSIKTDFKSSDQSTNYSISEDDGIKPFHFRSNDNAFSVGNSNADKNTYVFETKDGKTQTQSTGNTVYVFESDEEEKNGTGSTKIKIRKSTKKDTFFIKKGKEQVSWINRDGSKVRVKAFKNSNTNIFISETDEPLFVIDGEIVKKSLFEDIDSDDIKSINVLKGKTAYEFYGDKGKNGVIVMSKKGSKNLLINSNKNNNFKVDYEFIETEGDQPLYILDGKVIKNTQMSSVHPNDIDKLEVLKGDKATKIYGVKAKYGAVIINSKLSRKNDATIIEVIDNNPWKIKTAVSSVYFTDDNAKETVEFIISKTSTDTFLEQQKKALKAHGIDAKINKIRRNKAGEITGIKISLDDNKGRKSSASWKENDNGIPDIVLGTSGNKLFVRSLGN